MKPEQYGVMQDPAQAAQTSMGAAMQKMSETIAVVAEKIRKVQISNDVSNAEIARISDYASYEEDFNKGGDLKGLDSNLVKTREKVSKIIRDPQAKAAYLQEYELTALKFKHGLNTKQVQREVKESDILGRRDLNLRANELAALTNSDEREIKKQEMFDIVKARVDFGVWLDAQANEIYKEAIRNSVNTAMAVNSEFTLNELEKGESGIYKEIPETERKLLIAKNKEVLKKLMDEAEIFSLQQQLDFQKDFDDKVLTMNIGEALTYLESGADSGRCNDKWADASKRSILSTAGIDKDQADAYKNGIVMRIDALQNGYKILEKDEKKQLKHIRAYLKEVQSISTAIEDGKAKGLLVDVNELKKSLYAKSTAEATQAAIQGGRPWHTNIADAEKAYLPVMGAADRYAALRDYFFKTDGKKLSEEEKKEIINQAILTAQKKNYPESTNYEVGKFYKTPFGMRSFIGRNDNGDPQYQLIAGDFGYKEE